MTPTGFFILHFSHDPLRDVYTLNRSSRTNIDARVTSGTFIGIDGEHFPIAKERALRAGLYTLIAENTGTAADTSIYLPGFTAEINRIDPSSGY